MSTSLALYTNTVPAGSMRSIGGPQSIWALESHMDTIAARLGIEPLEFRMRHLLKRGDVLKLGATAIDADLRQGTKRRLRALNWHERVADRIAKGSASPSACRIPRRCRYRLR